MNGVVAYIAAELMSDADSDSDDDEIDMLFLQMMHRRDIPKIVGFVEDTVPEMDNLEFRRDFRCPPPLLPVCFRRRDMFSEKLNTTLGW